jgi:hypothetical protein
LPEKNVEKFCCCFLRKFTCFYTNKFQLIVNNVLFTLRFRDNFGEKKLLFEKVLFRLANKNKIFRLH